MHHGRDETERMREIARQMELGATGQHPEGRLNPADEGELKIGVGVEGGQVVLLFGKAVAWLGMSPQQARQLAESIRQKSYQAEGK